MYKAVVLSALLYSNETWPVQVADERMLADFDNDSRRRKGGVRWKCGADSALQVYRHD